MHARENPARGHSPVGGYSSPLLIEGEGSVIVDNKLQSLVSLSRAHGADRLSLETVYQPNPCQAELPLEVSHCRQGAGEAYHFKDAAFRLGHTPWGDQYPPHSHFEGGEGVGAVTNKTKFTLSRAKTVERLPFEAASPGVRHPFEEVYPHFSLEIDGSLEGHILRDGEDCRLDGVASRPNHTLCGDQPVCLAEPFGGKLWQKGLKVCTLDVAVADKCHSESEAPAAIYTGTSANTATKPEIALVKKSTGSGKLGPLWGKVPPDESYVTCDAGCGRKCLFFCSGCKFSRYCSKRCQNRDWNGHSEDCGLRFKGEERRSIVRAGRPPPLLRCSWLKSTGSFRICWAHGCARAGKFFHDTWVCGLGRGDGMHYFCSKSCLGKGLH